MGKYIKRSKIAGDVSVKDTSHPKPFSFRTRAAKNLALQRLRPHSISPSDDADSFRYLQLRSRRLVKLPSLDVTKKQLVEESRTKNPRAKKSEAETKVLVTETKEDGGTKEGKSGSGCNFGEKGFDFESEDRETKPCNLLRESEAPSFSEIEDFFASAEQQQHRFFIEKYNFDIVSENPLPGRYEWVKVVP